MWATPEPETMSSVLNGLLGVDERTLEE